MPPKKAPNAKDIKKKQKVVEDKTFGMKNKKGGKAQKVVQNLQKQAVGNLRSNSNKGKEPSKKQIKQQREEELRALGLTKVVPKKAAANPSDIENAVPGAEDAPEALAVAVSSKKEKTLEETIDEMRSKLTGPRTPVNATTFAEWKERKKREKELEEQQRNAKRIADIKAGKAVKTGRELVNFNPELFVDDDDAVETIERDETDDPLDDGPDVEAARKQMENLAVAEESSSANSVPIDESLFQAEDIPDDEDEDGEDDDDDNDDAGAGEDEEDHEADE